MKTYCPRCSRAMSDEKHHSIYDGKTIVCDVCHTQELIESGNTPLKSAKHVTGMPENQYWEA